MPHKGKNKFNRKGQASVEYLLVMGALFAGMAGMAGLFSGQVRRYLSFLLDWLTLPS